MSFSENSKLFFRNFYYEVRRDDAPRFCLFVCFETNLQGQKVDPSTVKGIYIMDGKSHFYLYFSNSGYGTGVLTATSPVGPWTSPLDKSIVDAKTSVTGVHDIYVRLTSNLNFDYWQFVK